MSYIRKTKDVYYVQGRFGYGWEEIYATDSRAEVEHILKEYIINDPLNDYRIIKRRERADLWE